MATQKELADLIYPDVTETIEDLQKKYPPRKNTYCSRFAPSPTGFLHIGGVFTALVARKYVKQNNGTYILRIEDTDQKRQVDGAVETLIQAMKTFGIDIDEGPIGNDHKDVGSYGPYTQSHRGDLYRVFVKQLLAEGKAYPCWMTAEELESTRDQQMKSKVMPGIYGNYAKRRNKSVDELIEQYTQDPSCVIRFRSHGNTQAKIVFDDVLRGKINMTDNYNDIVLLKRDGLPTYHLAHIVDDYLMRVSHIVRAEERLTSVPLHLQLFDAFNLTPPQYTHLAQLLKNDEETGKKRKLSKRKDPEANVDFFFEKGYAVQGIINYLFTIIDSNFEEWQKNNPEKTYKDFEIHLEKMNKSGALFDLTKMRAINNDYLSQIPTDDLYAQTLNRSKNHRPELYELMKNNEEYTKDAINIERFTEKDPKRFYTYEDVEQQLYFFYDDQREQLQQNKPDLPESLTQDVINAFVPEYIEKLDLTMTVEDWFAQLKEIGKKHGFAGNNKEFKEGGYIGKIGELAMLLRVQLCCMARTPDLYSVMQVMGKERITQRLMKLVK